MFNFSGIGGFQPEAIRFLRFKNAFDRAKAIRKSKERFRANAIETTNGLNVRKNINIRKPSVSEKNNVIIFTRKRLAQ